MASAAPAGAGSPQSEIELNYPPSDGISAVRFHHEEPALLLASSWDTGVRLYDVEQNSLKISYNHKAAVLDCCFSPNSNHAISGGVDKVVKMVDLNTSVDQVLGSHDAAVKCVEFSKEEALIVSGSWDKNVKFWDSRTKQCTGTYAQQNKVFTMALAGSRLVVGTAGRHVNIYDIRKMDEPEQRRESSLKFQTRCIRAFPDNSGYALSSIEGRVAMEYFDANEEAQAKKYAFKCHRQTINGVDTVYPVNAIAFHPKFGTFATGGCDGMVNVWDGANKKRLCLFHKFPTSIASLSFNSNGSLLAIASSYTFEEGEKDHPEDAIFIRQVIESEVKPKQKNA